jgi:hypothetical protein
MPSLNGQVVLLSRLSLPFSFESACFAVLKVLLIVSQQKKGILSDSGKEE